MGAYMTGKVGTVLGVGVGVVALFLAVVQIEAQLDPCGLTSRTWYPHQGANCPATSEPAKIKVDMDEAERQRDAARRDADEQRAARLKADAEARSARQYAEEQSNARQRADSDSIAARKDLKEQAAGRIRAEVEAREWHRAADEHYAARVTSEAETRRAAQDAQAQAAARQKAEGEAESAQQEVQRQSVALKKLEDRLKQQRLVQSPPEAYPARAQTGSGCRDVAISGQPGTTYVCPDWVRR
jgi:hypothetical protein